MAWMGTLLPPTLLPTTCPPDKIPMKRCGLISEIASLVAFIVSKEASFTTGFCFDATGGRATY
jgi:NAD(P)-dependent dehydrogenase (short-subunit alcohol dehydrogenase family)